MEFISKCTADTISNAAKALKDGYLVAFPTETVYGLGADATNEKAVSRIYSVKGRPSDHPLIVHISSINKLEDWATDIPDYAIKLAREFWPGPMTLILPKKEIAKNFITGGQNNVGLRVPDQPVALALLKKFEDLGCYGVAAPSANRFGAVSPTTARAVEDELGTFLHKNDSILDGGQSMVGIESTIIDCTSPEPRILRPGAVTKEMIELISEIKVNQDRSLILPRAPGMLMKHYSPNAKIVLDEKTQDGDGFIAFEKIKTPKNCTRLMSPHDLNEFGRELYKAFRKADKLGLQRVVISIPENIGFGEAIVDRIRKSSGII